MTQFDEAARKAAPFVIGIIEIMAGSGVKMFNMSEETYLCANQEVSSEIAKHFAEIEAVHKKLCELVILMSNLEDGKRVDELLADPQVKAAMERSKE